MQEWIETANDINRGLMDEIHSFPQLFVKTTIRTSLQDRNSVVFVLHFDTSLQLKNFILISFKTPEGSGKSPANIGL